MVAKKIQSNFISVLLPEVATVSMWLAIASGVLCVRHIGFRVV